jgi:hypothetical protein
VVTTLINRVSFARIKLKHSLSFILTLALLLAATGVLGQSNTSAQIQYFQKPSGISPNRPATATVDGIRQIRNLHFLLHGVKLLDVIELVPPFDHSAEVNAVIKKIDNSDWQLATDEIQRLDFSQRDTLTKLVAEIQNAVHLEVKKAKRSGAPNKYHLMRERKMWQEIYSAIQYRSPQRQKMGQDFSNAPAVYIGTAKALNLYLKYKKIHGKNESAHKRQSNGLLLFPQFNLINIPCFGVSIDIKITIETPPDSPHPFKRKKFDKIEGIEIPGQPTPLIKDSHFSSSEFLLNGRSLRDFSVSFPDSEIKIPPGIYLLNVNYQVFLDEVPVTQSATFPIRYRKK